MSHQVCHCGWSKVTTYHGLRTHQGKMGCTPRGMGIPESQQFRFNDYLPRLTYPGPLMKVEEPLMNIFTPAFKSDERLHIPESQPNIFGSLRNGGSSNGTSPVKTEMGAWLGAAALDVPVRETKKWEFQTPPPSATTQQAPARPAPASVCRALDFATGAQQAGQLFLGQLFPGPPTTTPQETFEPNERQKEKERETQQLQKARQDRTRAALQHDIQATERKMAEVRSSVKACKGGLDAEWLEINDVFSGVMRAVEGARRKALGPLEERRKKVKKEAELLFQRLQKEIDKLVMTLDELERDPDLKVSSQTGDLNSVAVNTSFSFGSLRTTTSNMMKEIQQELEKLSSVELKRIPTFAVDVKLDPTTAHRCLLLSPDGKTVRDAGDDRQTVPDHQAVPDGPRRFDVFGSVVGLAALPPGRSYWEVDVGDKTGWDLGVARADARRKGKLSLDPGSGYWVAVHFEGEKYAAMTAPPVRLPVAQRPRRVGVFVDRAEGLVSFYDAAAKSHIYSFVGCAFGGEVLPYFSPHLRQNGKNSRPLSLSAVVADA
ncbi:E3 ubiquitin-protein ligase TRIM39-like [Pungitius pungitius]|uniref:E3 ubiquitin-protein ligase TRIM39-like n=1 Tax=Pungitius pungitius TaxID=134920 RepID=UPI002E151992